MNASDYRFDTAGNAAVVFNNSIGVHASWQVQWGPGSPTATADLGLRRGATSVLQITDATSAANGWMQWAGLKRVTSDFSVTSQTALQNVTDLVVALQAGQTYTFLAYLTCTCAAAGGVKAAVAATGGLTATNIIYDGWTNDTNAMKGQANATALGTTVASTTTTATTGLVIEIRGTITVNVGGNLQIQFAQNTSSGTASIVKRGSYLLVFNMP